MSTTITHRAWGSIDNQDVFLFTLENSAGAFVEITNYGATLVSINVPDKNGRLENVIVGFPTLAGYLDDKSYIGSTIGRYANRISNAQFSLDGAVYQLEANDGVNSNHSASSGFNNKVFGFEINDDELVMVLHSNDGDGGYPGNLSLRVTYKWNDENQLSIHYKAVSDKDTFANFTNHAYFNLSNSDQTIANHKLDISTTNIVAAVPDYIPTGKIIPAQPIVININRGINSYYILDKEKLAANSYAAQLTEPKSGRTLTVTTSYPGIFLYTGDYLSSKHLNLKGRYCQSFEGLCLECQLYPDAMNRPEFPSTLLKKHQVYDEYINLKFGLV
jgi:aldose 1-epimerase